jgi:hypothetical protein
MPRGQPPTTGSSSSINSSGAADEGFADWSRKPPAAKERDPIFPRLNHADPFFLSGRAGAPRRNGTPSLFTPLGPRGARLRAFRVQKEMSPLLLSAGECQKRAMEFAQRAINTAHADLRLSYMELAEQWRRVAEAVEELERDTTPYAPA